MAAVATGPPRGRKGTARQLLVEKRASVAGRVIEPSARIARSPTVQARTISTRSPPSSTLTGTPGDGLHLVTTPSTNPHCGPGACRLVRNRSGVRVPSSALRQPPVKARFLVTRPESRHSESWSEPARGLWGRDPRGRRGSTGHGATAPFRCCTGVPHSAQCPRPRSATLRLRRVVGRDRQICYGQVIFVGNARLTVGTHCGW